MILLSHWCCGDSMVKSSQLKWEIYNLNFEEFSRIFYCNQWWFYHLGFWVVMLILAYLDFFYPLGRCQNRDVNSNGVEVCKRTAADSGGLWHDEGNVPPPEVFDPSSRCCFLTSTKIKSRQSSNALSWMVNWTFFLCRNRHFLHRDGLPFLDTIDCCTPLCTREA